MSLPNILGGIFKKSQSPKDNYLSLIITPDRVLATIWTFENEEIKTLGFGHKSFASEDILVHQAAIAVDSAGQQAKVDITKTVFGLSNYYLEDGALSQKTTKILKKLATELELEPQAFVPISAAISHLLKVEESTTPHAIILDIFGDFCEIHLLENGTAVNSKTTQSPVNIEKIKNLIDSLKEENRELPARIIVCGIGESAEISEKIAKIDWGNIFVHEPKIDFLDDTELCRGVAYAQAADILGYDPQILTQKKSTEPDAQTMPEPEPESVQEQQDIEKKEYQPKANEMGFVEGEDVLLSQKPEEKPQEYALPEEPVQNIMVSPARIVEKSPKVNFPSLSSIFSIFKIIPSAGSSKRALILAGIFIFILILGTFIYSQAKTQAEIVIKVSGQQLEKDFRANIVSGASYNQEDKTIPGQILAGRAYGSQKAVTTGSKKLGDPAQGEVTVYNWTNSQKSFSKGTGIISKNGIKFALDADVEVASRSATTPGQFSVKVLAVDVGPGGNLDAGQDFSFQEFDELSYSAINNAAFSGGAERQTTVVTAEDLSRLQKSLQDTTTQKAKEDLKNQTAGAKFHEDATVIKILKSQFDKAEAEEAPLLNLDMEVEASAIVYSEDDLKKLLSEVFAGEAPENLVILPQNVGLDNLQVDRNDDEMRISGKAKLSLVPKINEDELKGKIAGKSIKETRAQIKEIPEVAQVEVNFKPNIPFFSSIPRNKSKISFKIETI